MKKENYIKKWLEGNLSEKERNDFETTQDYKTLEKLSRAISAFKAPQYDTEHELSRIHNRMSEGPKVVSLNWLSPLVRIAAVLILMAGVGYFVLTDHFGPSQNIISFSKEPFFLPDSSQVILNVSSRLKYSKNEWGKERMVELNGEGFFKVTKGSKFGVKTESGTVYVLGTQFNVKSRPDYFEVICYEGSVEVLSSEKNRILKPNQMFRIIDGIASDAKISSMAFPGWLKGESRFESVPVIYVIKEFERQYQVTVDKGDLNGGQLFSGSFTHFDINLAMRSITEPLNLEYRIDGNQVVLGSDLKE